MPKYCPLRMHAHQVTGHPVTGGNVTEKLADEYCACLEGRCALWHDGKCGLLVQDVISSRITYLADELVNLSTSIDIAMATLCEILANRS